MQLLLSKSNIDVTSKYIYRYNLYENEKTALFAAINLENIVILMLLLSRKDIDVNFKSLSHYNEYDEYSEDTYEIYEEEYALYLAVMYNNIKMVELLLENKNIDVNSISTSIKYMDNYDYYDETYEKIEYENIKLTALHLAVQNENIPIIKLLMKHRKINKNIKDNNGKKPIDLVHNYEIRDIFSSK